MSIKRGRMDNWRRRLRCAIFALFAVGALTAVSLAAPDSLLEKNPNLSRKTILDSGLTVATYEMPTSTTVAVYVLVKTGSATEGKYLGTGISHFVEHMLFKGTEKRGVGEVAKEVKALGGMINASTSFDQTMYYIELPSQYYGKAIEIMADMLMNSKLDPEEVEKERQVIFGEVRLYRDRPERKMSELVQANSFLVHPYRHPIIGYDALLDEISRQALWDYYKKFYIPNNMVLAVTGNIKTEDVLSEVKRAFGGFQRQPDVVRHLPYEPPQLSERYYEEEYKTDIPRLDMAYHSVGILNEDLHALDVLAMILGQGSASRLKRELYDKQRLVWSIRSGNFTPVDPGLFEIEVECPLENIEKVITEVKKQVERIKTQSVSVQELDRAKAQVASRNVLSKQTAGYMAYVMAYDEAFTGDFRFSEKYVDAVKRLTPDDIKRVANKYLRDANLTTVVLKPLGSIVPSKERADAETAGEIKKIVLENGVTVLLREDHTLPLVFIRLVLQGGTRQEPAELNGISQLMARLWVRETQSLSVEKLADITESKAFSVGEIAGRNSFGIEMYGLSEHLSFGLDLLEDFVKRPGFSEKEFEKDKKQMKVIIQSKNEDISYVTAHNLREVLFPGHPFRLNETGTLESVERIQHKDVIDFYDTFVAPNNMVLSVFGDIDAQEVGESISKLLGNLKPKKVPLVDHDLTALTEMQERTVLFNREQAVVMMGFRGPTIADEDRYPLEVLTSILGSPLSGRMFTKIRDELGQAYTLGAGSVPGPDAGFIYFYVNTTDENINKVKELLLEEVAGLQTAGITDEELSRTKMYLKGTFQRSLETSSALGSIALFDELYGLGFDHYKEYDEKIGAVTKEDIQRIARKYLDVDQAAMVVTRSKAAPEGAVSEKNVP